MADIEPGPRLHFVTDIHRLLREHLRIDGSVMPVGHVVATRPVELEER
jgi:hypothetical protein